MDGIRIRVDHDLDSRDDIGRIGQFHLPHSSSHVPKLLSEGADCVVDLVVHVIEEEPRREADAQPVYVQVLPRR